MRWLGGGGIVAGGIVDGIEVQLRYAFAARRARRVLHGGGVLGAGLAAGCPMRNVRWNVRGRGVCFDFVWLCAGVSVCRVYGDVCVGCTGGRVLSAAEHGSST